SCGLALLCFVGGACGGVFGFWFVFLCGVCFVVLVFVVLFFVFVGFGVGVVCGGFVCFFVLCVFVVVGGGGVLVFFGV
ncbi:hypothetical protein, partial [Staphylococcus aureus]|uniref:hypothetical protein n=1 Tax=Staphylococcus aureus TaxID=1280 RepID=UPI00289855AD